MFKNKEQALAVKSVWFDLLLLSLYKMLNVYCFYIIKNACTLT